MYVPRVLIFAVLAEILSVFMVGNQASGHQSSEVWVPEGPIPHSGAFLKRRSTSRAPVSAKTLSKKYKFISQCAYNGTAGFLQMLPSGAVNAKGTSDNPNTVIILHSVSMGIVKIQSAATGRYLCFSRKGKLKTRKSGRSAWCNFFHEVYIYDQFRSAYNESRVLNKKHNDFIRIPNLPMQRKNSDWKIAFNAAGKPLTIHIKNKQKNRNCFNFVRQSINEGLNRTSAPNLGLSEAFNKIRNATAKSSVNKQPKARDSDKTKPRKKSRSKMNSQKTNSTLSASSDVTFPMTKIT